MNLKKTIIGTLLVLSASYAAAAYYGDYNIDNTTGSYNWNTAQWVDSEGASLDGYPPYLTDSVYIGTNSINVDITNEAYAKEVSLGITSGKTSPVSLRFCGEGAFLYVGNDGDVGGSINSVDAATGDTATLGWTMQSRLTFSSDNTTGVSSRFTNASEFEVYIVEVGHDSQFAGTEWLITQDCNYTVSGWLNVGATNGSNKGDFTAAITHTAGTLNVSRILFSSGTSDGAVSNTRYTLDGGKFNVSSVHLGNTYDVDQSGDIVTIDANFNLLSGEISHYNSYTDMTFRDSFGHDNKKSTGMENNGAFNLNFSDKKAAYEGYAGSHSAMVFNTSTPIIRFEDTVYLKDYQSTAGGFTIRGNGKLYNYATATITGKISVLDTATLVVSGTDSIDVNGVNVDMVGKMFETASEIYVSSGAKFDFSKSAVQKVFSGQTISGAGQILASTSQNLQIFGSLAPAGDDGAAGKLAISGNGTVEMSKDASLVFNLFSSDGKSVSSADKISFATATRFVEMNEGEGLGKFIFDTSQILEDTSFLLSSLFENADADWSKFEFLTTEASRVQAAFDGVDTINLSIIPEPSAFAIALGALALGFAARRRMKR